MLHDLLETVLRGVNAEGPVLDPVVITLGDEFQGVYDTLGDALRASFRIRALLHPTADVRFGLGRGEITILDRRRGIQGGDLPYRFRADRLATEAAVEEVSASPRVSRYMNVDLLRTTWSAILETNDASLFDTSFFFARALLIALFLAREPFDDS